MGDPAYPNLTIRPGGFVSQRSVNLFSEDFIAGYMQDGHMSTVRRFFCLFTTFDFLFVALLWIICIVINGQPIKEAIENQILNYNIENSLFDVVMAAGCRFVVIILFYALLSINHWLIIALSTSSSCAFLIYKVFIFNWQATQQPVFEVLLVIVSFVITWSEAWFLDCRVIPQERYADFVTRSAMNSDARTPLLSNLLPSMGGPYGQPESIHNFYSPFESLHNSESEDDQQDEEFKKLGIEIVEKAYEYLEMPGWKVEKVTASEDTILSNSKSVGKFYKLTGKVNYPAKLLLKELFYKIEDVPKWNPTLLESRIIHKIDACTDIAYSVSSPGGGGLVKSRDFVNLRCYQTLCDGQLVKDDEHVSININLDNENATVSEEPQSPSILKKSSSEVTLNLNGNPAVQENISQLSKSLDPRLAIFNQERDQHGSPSSSGLLNKPKKVFVSAAVSVDYPAAPPCKNFVRGQNILSCWAMRETDSEDCIFEWLLCLDLKGSIPKYILNTAYLTLMQDYMTHLRNHVETLRRTINT